jgi:YHS domain-containing protein
VRRREAAARPPAPQDLKRREGSRGEDRKETKTSFKGIGEVSEMAIDPVCRMEVEPETAAAQAEYKGNTYYFCARGCKAAFEKDPEKYLKEMAEGDGAHHHAP